MSAMLITGLSVLVLTAILTAIVGLTAMQNLKRGFKEQTFDKTFNNHFNSMIYMALLAIPWAFGLVISAAAIVRDYFMGN